MIASSSQMYVKYQKQFHFIKFFLFSLEFKKKKNSH